MKKIAILQCKNTKDELVCSSMACLKDFNEGNGTFKQHENPVLMGMLSCAGCPTAVGPEKLKQKIKGLAESGIEALHISSCIALLCPFKNKYISMIEKEFPGLEVIVGTHDAPDDVKEQFKGMVKSFFSAERQTIDLAGNEMAKQQQALAN